MPNFVWNKMGPVGSAMTSMSSKLAAVSTLAIHKKVFSSIEVILVKLLTRKSPKVG